MSTRGARRPARLEPEARQPAPAGAFVAVLERRGRFLAAVPLFPVQDRPASPRVRGGGVVVGSAPSGKRASAGATGCGGDLVLVAPALRGRRAEVLRVLGRPDVARDVIEGLMLDRGLARGFTGACEREAAGAAGRVAGEQVPRRDLRDLPTFTIDPASARDFDDAISARDAGDGSSVVWVHIADVAAHVPPGSLVDREAQRRATSVYAPGAVEPMLPHVLSSDACSLMPGVDRAAVTVELSMRQGVVTGVEFHRSLIRSDARLDYERVDRVFAAQERTQHPWGAPLQVARTVAAALAARRERAGALVLDSSEPDFSFDEHGHVVAVSARRQTESHRLVEHLMIAANEAVAGFLARRGAGCLYRVHERPDPERVIRLVDQLASLGVSTPPLPERMSSTQASELLGDVSQRVQAHLQRHDGRGRIALGSLILRSLKQAYYSPSNLGHAGLHSTTYCHFTSPIRRYPDLVCHRALLSAIGAGEHPPATAPLAELGAWCSEREREAMVLERDSDDVARCFALQRRLREGDPDEVFAGEITGLISAGAFVAFGEDAQSSRAEERARDAPPPPPEGPPPFEGMLPVRLLRVPGRSAPAGRGERIAARAAVEPRAGVRRARGRPVVRAGPERAAGGERARDWWELNEQGTVLRGERSGATLRLGDPIEVRVSRIEAPRGRVELLPAG